MTRSIWKATLTTAICCKAKGEMNLNAIFTPKDRTVYCEDLYFDGVISVETVEDIDGNHFARVRTMKYHGYTEISLEQYDMKLTTDSKEKEDNPEYFLTNNMYGIFERIGVLLNHANKECKTELWFDGERILSPHKNDIDWLMTVFEELNDEICGDFLTITGYYDQEEDERNNEVDSHTGMYYLELE